MKSSVSVMTVALVVLVAACSAVACRVCLKICPKGSQAKEIQDNGRTVCRCVDICKEKDCLPQEKCVLMTVQCFRAPCPPIATCVPCPKPMCPKVCPKGTFQTEVQENGCTVCKCINPCQEKQCQPQEKCVLQTVVCVRAPCPPIATCVPTCPSRACPKICPEGTFRTEVQENGCTVCKCVNPCKEKHCLPQEKCVLKKVYCKRLPCPPIAVCVPTCPSPVCPKICPKGTFQTEVQENGCTVCKCVNPCQEKHCLPQEKCVLTTVQCLRAPCPPIATCVPM
ncbi:hypothetical protein NP493_646g01076 [Ridgeia piscesae]|uniref:Uncharacterized protein n=1 Tax=Ridgeia piscesae TaxID=27915 RepID=A0AAD9KSU7_RIDPI|nr:hypothetical protein NP493_646g01076 [Ridgeia piscesae]